ncbi:MAG: DUF5702 domain-containing protein [bacterium]|nr:DUF5702 domain-containing protein [bacterium]
MRRGGITVFLTSMLLLFVTLVSACVEAVRFYAVGVEAECAVSMGMDSVFAEYHRGLLEQYDLFFIDSSYGAEQPSYHYTEAHLWDYIAANLSAADVPVWNGRDFLDMHLEGVSVVQAALATDGCGRDVKYQAVSYMRERVGIGLIEEVQAQMDTVRGNGLDVRDVEQEAAQVQAQIDGTPLPEQQLEDGSFVEVSVDNPADSVNSGRFRGILYLVADQESLSDQAVNPDNYVSHRTLNTGTGAACGDTAFSVVDEVLFGEYLIEKCGNYRKPSAAGALQYELEYILAGKSSDIENLRWVAGRLILLREAANAAYLYSDSTKVSEADVMAWGLAIVSLKPDLQPLIKNSILLAWAYAESVSDVRRLFSGERVPLLKSRETWHLSLEHMLDYVTHLGETGEEQEGLDYEAYLRLLLLLEQTDTKTMRCMDVIEMNMRKLEGSESFRMDGCIDAMCVEVSVSGGFGEYFNLAAQYCYLDR